MIAENVSSNKDAFFKNIDNKDFAREELIYNVTEDLLVILEDMGVSKKDLSDRLGKSRAYITQLLSGSRNMTLGSFSDICFVLGFKPEVKLPVENKSSVIAEIVEIKKTAWLNKTIGERKRTSINSLDRGDSPHWVRMASNE